MTASTTVPSATRPIADVAAALVAVLGDKVKPSDHPLDRYLEHLRLRNVLQLAAQMMTAECGSDLASALDSGMRPKDIVDVLGEYGVTLSTDGVAHLAGMARRQPSPTRQ